jgi:DinB superfamily
MLQSLADELTRVIDVAGVEFRTINEAVAASKRGPDVWSVKEIVGHLVDSAANNHQRFVRAQRVKEFSFPGYEQDAWVQSQDYQSRSWPELIDLLVLYNHHLAHVIRRMPDSAAEVPCQIGTNKAVSLGFIVEDYLVHLRHHLKQIRERRP